MPTLSVTLIGLIVAAATILVGKSAPLRTLLYGVAGAWAGFAGGAVIGVVIDVITLQGVFLAYVGHAAAAVVAIVASRRALSETAAARENAEAGDPQG